MFAEEKEKILVMDFTRTSSKVPQKNWQLCNTATQLCQINDKRYILQVLRINIDRSEKL